MPRSATNSEGSLAYSALEMESIYLNSSPDEAQFRHGMPLCSSRVRLLIIDNVHHSVLIPVVQCDVMVGVSTPAAIRQTSFSAVGRKEKDYLMCECALR